MRDTDTRTTETVPDGWPPPTPVELLRVGRGLAVLAVALLGLNAAALAWLAYEVRSAHVQAQLRQLVSEDRR